jgi:hypothetical protein
MQGHLLLPNSITCKLNRIHLNILGQQARHIIELKQRNQALTTQVTSMQQQLKDQAEISTSLTRMMALLERVMHAELAEVRQGITPNLEGKLLLFDERMGHIEDRLDATQPPPHCRAPISVEQEDTSSEEPKEDISTCHDMDDVCYSDRTGYSYEEDEEYQDWVNSLREDALTGRPP